MNLSHADINEFRQLVLEHFAHNRRAMPWREHPEPYWVVVSEIMLQQTQVDRVRPKFAVFIARFPSFASLAAAPLSEVLGLWIGLGYNRRAKFLHGTAKEVMERYNGQLPRNLKELTTLPGIGPNTAGAIMAYAYNVPVVFIETNVRSVVLHYFFANQEKVSDELIREVVTQTLDTSNPREWYWALMDYGSYLKKQHGNNISRAASYRRQSTFKGSLRQVRGKVIALLATTPRTTHELENLVNDERLTQVLAQLSHEKLILTAQDRVQLAE
ncbi:MAG TPA: hypothetical protein VLF60_00515 [Candidatus Saccharimonadales bacterium]|nr:hypothetical protein [Candidatus Saccharimonadales bacterium]